MKGVTIMALEEKLNQAKGALKENVGKLTGDKKLESEGAVEKTTAKVKDVVEDVKDAVEGALDGLKNSVDNDKEQPHKENLIKRQQKPVNRSIYWFIIAINLYYTLKRKCVTSPSFITYSLPSRRTRPFSLAAFWLPQACKSSKDTISARIKPFSISE